MTCTLDHLRCPPHVHGHARCGRCSEPACRACDRCHGCGYIICEGCDSHGEPFTFEGDARPHPHNADGQGEV